jgi:hypothetical protein
VIPEIDIWRAATLMLKRYGDKALEENATRADELASAGDDNGVAVWRRISDAVGQLVNTPRPTGSTDCPRHWRRQGLIGDRAASGRTPVFSSVGLLVQGTTPAQLRANYPVSRPR